MIEHYDSAAAVELAEHQINAPHVEGCEVCMALLRRAAQLDRTSGISVDMGSTDAERKAFARGWGAGFSAASSVDEPVDRARLAWSIYMAEFDELVKDGQDLTFDAAADLLADTYDSTTEVPVDWYQLRKA